MKKNFTSNELPHIWAQQLQSEGKAGSFYFNGATIYSYGSHFPIATIEGKNVLFTKRTYSNSTAKHISKTRQAISHKNKIYCYYVPTNLKYASREHSQNFERWKKEIQTLFAEIGNTRNKNIDSRINSINGLVNELNVYCTYFKIKVTDVEFKKLLKLIAAPDFLQKAIEAKSKENELHQKKVKESVKAYGKYLDLWRAFNEDAIKELPAKTKELCNFYRNTAEAFTHLRYNVSDLRLETSKGVQIPIEIAKRAYIALNGCMEGECKNINVPVLHYTITETSKTYIKAGCHTIPKTDIKYIATLLNW